MNTEITVKVTLNDETRKITVSKDNTMKELAAKCTEYFGLKKFEMYNLVYADAEGDRIILSGAEELNPQTKLSLVKKPVAAKPLLEKPVSLKKIAPVAKLAATPAPTTTPIIPAVIPAAIPAAAPAMKVIKPVGPIVKLPFKKLHPGQNRIIPTASTQSKPIVPEKIVEFKAVRLSWNTSSGSGFLGAKPNGKLTLNANPTGIRSI